MVEDFGIVIRSLLAFAIHQNSIDYETDDDEGKESNQEDADISQYIQIADRFVLVECKLVQVTLCEHVLVVVWLFRNKNLI